MLNNKGGSIAQHYQQHQFIGSPSDYHHSHISLIKPEPSMERSVSPHMSEHSSYSTPHSIARSYNSPAAMQAPLHMQNHMTSQMHLPTFPDMSGAMGAVHGMGMHQMAHQSQVAAQPSKAFACATCNKTFARRSDLARHGMLVSAARFAAFTPQNVYRLMKRNRANS